MTSITVWTHRNLHDPMKLSSQISKSFRMPSSFKRSITITMMISITVVAVAASMANR